ncbi:MAG: hypothetical protein ABIT71_01170 [Vicinamibacteraceae bacterium]
MAWTRWTTSSRFMRALPLRSQLLFFAGTFFVFLPTGLLTDVAKLGATPVGRLVLSSIIAGSTAVAYTAVARFGAGWMAVLAPFHFFGVAGLDRWRTAGSSTISRCCWSGSCRRLPRPAVIEREATLMGF